MARTRIPPPPVSTEDRTVWINWYVAVKDAINNLRQELAWTSLDFTGSNLTDVVTKSHQVLDNLQGGSVTERYHLTSTQASAIAAFNATQWTDLTDGGESTLHYHASDRDSANFTGTNWTDLTDAGDSTLHYHSADRARANHTGTQTLATISDAGTAASQSGLSVTITTAALTVAGTQGSMTFTNGVLTAQTAAT